MCSQFVTQLQKSRISNLKSRKHEYPCHCSFFPDFVIKIRCQITQGPRNRVPLPFTLPWREGPAEWAVSALHSAFSCRKRVPFPKPRNAFRPSLLLLNSSLAHRMSPSKSAHFGDIFTQYSCLELWPDSSCVTSDQLNSSLCKDEPTIPPQASSKSKQPHLLFRQRPHRGVS